MPIINMWWAQTKKLKTAMATEENATAVYPNTRLRLKVETTSLITPMPGKMDEAWTFPRDLSHGGDVNAKPATSCTICTVWRSSRYCLRGEGHNPRCRIRVTPHDFVGAKGPLVPSS